MIRIRDKKSPYFVMNLRLKGSRIREIQAIDVKKGSAPRFGESQSGFDKYRMRESNPPIHLPFGKEADTPPHGVPLQESRERAIEALRDLQKAGVMKPDVFKTLGVQQPATQSGKKKPLRR